MMPRLIAGDSAAPRRRPRDGDPRARRSRRAPAAPARRALAAASSSASPSRAPSCAVRALVLADEPTGNLDPGHRQRGRAPAHRAEPRARHHLRRRHAQPAARRGDGSDHALDARSSGGFLRLRTHHLRTPRGAGCRSSRSSSRRRSRRRSVRARRRRPRVRHRRRPRGPVLVGGRDRGQPPRRRGGDPHPHPEPGRPAPRSGARRQDVRAIYAMGFFDDVEVEWSRPVRTARRCSSSSCSERPHIATVKIEGGEEAQARGRRGGAQGARRAPSSTPRRSAAASTTRKKLYEEKGYLDATITPRPERPRRRRRRRPGLQDRRRASWSASARSSSRATTAFSDGQAAAAS